MGGVAPVIDPEAPQSLVSYPTSPPGVLRFIVIGDVGTGDETQKAVAQAFNALCVVRGCDMVLVAGDNIYPDGVRSAFDPQFEEKFENPYAEVKLPFYLVLGNHDNGGGVGTNPAMAEHQIAYTFRTDRTTMKWNMPARNYRVSLGDVDLFGLDSGPEEVTWSSAWMPNSLGDQMAQWFRAEMAKSTASWKIVFAHHPYISNGEHGIAGVYDNIPSRGLPYRAMLDETMCRNTDVFFAGHDHHLAWMEPLAECGDTHFIISGAGGAGLYDRGLPPDLPARFEDYDSHGFVWAEIDGEQFTAAFYDKDGALLFEDSFTRA
jgi:hypothetical protein